MIKPKSTTEIKIMREGGKRHAEILAKLADFCQVGTSSFAVEELTQQLCREYQVVPTFHNYLPDGASYAFPAGLCFSVNDEIVHGIPNQVEKILQNGDVLTLDLGITYQNLITDSAITIGIGEISQKNKDLIQVTKTSLDAGINAAVLNKPVSLIGAAIEQSIRSTASNSKSAKYAIYRGLVGHGVGYEVHEEPNIPNFDTRSQFPVLPEGAVIAIEPMVGLGSPKFVLDNSDDWTYRTYDGSVSAHAEHTVAFTANGPLILTAL